MVHVEREVEVLKVRVSDFGYDYVDLQTRGIGVTDFRWGHTAVIHSDDTYNRIKWCPSGRLHTLPNFDALPGPTTVSTNTATWMFECLISKAR